MTQLISKHNSMLPQLPMRDENMAVLRSDTLTKLLYPQRRIVSQRTRGPETELNSLLLAMQRTEQLIATPSHRHSLHRQDQNSYHVMHSLHGIREHCALRS